MTEPRQTDPKTGMMVGSASYEIAQALIEGGAGKAEVIAKVAEILPSKTRNDTDQPVTQRVNTVLSTLQQIISSRQC